MRAGAAAAVAALCVGLLIADWMLERRLPARSDAKVSAAEQKRITAARRARKARDGVIGWVLIGAAGVFLVYVERMPVRARGTVSDGRKTKSAETSHGAEGVGACATSGCTHREDLSFVDGLVAEYGHNQEAAIPILQAIQTHYRYLPDEALQRICELTEVTPAQIAGTSSFYGQFRRSPVGEHLVRVCHGTACNVAGARQINDEIRRYLAIPEGADTDPARRFTVEEVACLGCCSLAPVVMVDGKTAGRLTPAGACDALQEKA